MNVIVYGYGLMGKKVAQAVRDNEKMDLVGVVSPVFDEKIDENMYSSLEEVNEKVDAIIDFSHPNNLEDILKFGIKNHCALVIATTGFNDQQKLHIEEASSQIPIFQSYNTSFGVSMLTKIVKSVAKEFYEQLNFYMMLFMKILMKQKKFMIVVKFIIKKKKMKLVFNQYVLEQFLVNILYCLQDMMKLSRLNIRLYLKMFLYKELSQLVMQL